ncbi:MAG: radical SAM family heme chaperone HemW [Pseudomonadota bacterium]
MLPPLVAEDWQNAGFGLYVHWPFCQSKCPYCDFNSHVSGKVDQAVWADALVSEVRRVGDELGRRPLTSVFFGGGTPSLMEEHAVGAVIDAATDVFAPTNDLEITLEANPSSVERSRFEGYRAAGVNRVSLGVQALNDKDLRALGRLHSVAEARAAIDTAQSTFDEVSFDLIYARQNQSAEAWEAELNEALSIGTGHLSLYQLTIEPDTAFGDRHARGRLRGLPTDDTGADMFAATEMICSAAERPGYETSNHARPGSECKHNMIYWQSGDYAGVGPGAHGRHTLGGARYATEAIRAPSDWLSQVQSRGDGEALREEVDAMDRADEFLLMGLRTRQGIDLNRYFSLGGKLQTERVKELESGGWIKTDKNQLRVTAAGRPILNAILRELLT